MGKLYNLARVGTATAGTGTITLGSAVTGFLTFSDAGVTDGQTITYAIQDGAQSEIGTGVYTHIGETLTRATILRSTNNGSALNLSGTGTQVFVTPSAEDFYRLPNTLGNFGVTLAAGTNVTAARTLTLTTGDANRAVTVAADLAFSAAADLSPIASVNSGPLAGLRNRLINGGMRINQRLAATNADDTYAHDRWNILTQTGTVAASTATLIENTWTDALRITQSQAAAQRFGVLQIIESQNCRDLRGQAVSLSARVRMSATTTLRYAVLEWTGTADTVTSDVVNDWTSATFTAGNFFNSTTLTVTATGSTALTANTAATVSLSTTLGSSTSNVIVLFWTDSTQAQNVTLDVGKAQFEIGATATVFEARPYPLEMMLCQRYYTKSFPVTTAPANGALPNQEFALFGWASNSAQTQRFFFPVTMRATPTMVFYQPNNGATAGQWSWYNGSWNDATSTAIAFIGGDASHISFSVDLTKTASFTVTASYIAAGHYTASSEL